MHQQGLLAILGCEINRTLRFENQEKYFLLKVGVRPAEHPRTKRAKGLVVVDWRRLF